MFALREQADGTAHIDQNNANEGWIYEDKDVWEMIAELEAVIQKTALEVVESEKQKTE